MTVNDYAEFCEEFLEFEDSFDLMNRRICDVYFWERIRFSVHSHLRRSLVDSTDNSSVTGPRNYLSGMWLLLKNWLIRNPIFAQDTDLLFFGTGRRKQSENGQWWDLYHDPIMESSTRDCLMWERPYETTHLTPSKTSNLKYVDMIEYTGTLLQKLGISTVSFSEKELLFLRTVENEIVSRFDVDIPLVSMVAEDISKRLARLTLYEKLLARVNPSIAFLTVSYGGRETFVEACQSEGITVVELQHGAMSRYHMAYSFPYNEKHVFPDYFFSFGDLWSDVVEFPLPDERMYSVGYPYLELESRKYGKVDTQEQIIFFSQGSIGVELSRFAVELSCQEDYERDIIYKLHPSEYQSWEGKYPWLATADLQVVDSDSPPLYRLFAESAAQIGVGSTAVYEGLNFELDTYVLDIPSETHKLEPLIQAGYAELISDTDELVDHSKTGGDQQLELEAIFKSNAIENITNAVDEIQAKQE